ncbi:Uncharacterised protein [Amycolatopsis camponoti]|uniref:Uncharacterized protein n=1 Tax=Amycolatopsis camponoti TaxID=2606593 RepID=A0A6I8LN94_9PSEU|nr:hypothetical protein [Amycolatopsis camponoti]VVJ17447.1 Uncharacterised protein [Amycolatopsis camponoti]
MNGVNVTWPFAGLLVTRGQAELRVHAVEPTAGAETVDHRRAASGEVADCYRRFTRSVACRRLVTGK